jgi:hypothetical protein
VNSETTPEFWQLYRALPSEVRERARAAYALFEQDLSHPGLRFKRIGLREPMYSARIGLHYRVVGLLDGDTVVWWWIGSHADYDKLIQQF